MNEKRYSLYPIKHKDLFDRYKAVEKQFWTASIADFSEDNFDSLDESQQRYLKMLIFFFANSDSVVADNIVLNFLSREDLPVEAGFFYGYQTMNENIHNECYALIIQEYIKDLDERYRAFNSIFNYPVVAKKMKWAEKWMDSEVYEENLIAFVAVEMILFSSTFAGIFGFKDLKKPLKGLYVYNSEILRDEHSHGEFGIHFYNNHITNKLPKERVREIILEAYEVEKTFVDDSFGDGVTGFSKLEMFEYVKFVTDNVLVRLGQEPEFNVAKCPLKYMENLGVANRENFFEGRNVEYTKLDGGAIEIDEDF